MQQRGIPDEVTQRIVEEGIAVSASEGATFYRVPDKLCKAQIAYHRQQIRLLEKVACKAILVDGEAIITVMHCDKKLFQK